jgi:hypothetical protein
MRLVTYDRGGARRLGALVARTVVDLPDAVGHPAFPTTMEALVTRHGGTTLDAARYALGRPEYIEGCLANKPRLLVPIVPASLLEFEPAEMAPRRGRARREALASAPPPSGERRRTLFGPGEELPWPSSAAALRFGVEVACVLGLPGDDVSPPQAARLIFGYTLKVTWSVARPARRRRNGEAEQSEPDFATCLGPWVVTRDEFDPSDPRMVVKIDRRLVFDGDLGPVRRRLADLIAHVSKDAPVCAGDIFAWKVPTELSDGLARTVRPGVSLEVGIGGLGSLRTRIGRPLRPGRRPALAYGRPALAS